MLDARRGQVYGAAFDVSSGMPVRVLADGAMALDDFLTLLPTDRRLAFLGDGVEAHVGAVRGRLGERALIFPKNLRDLRADAACVLAAARRESWVFPEALKPLYLRAPQAERERAARLLREAAHD